MARKKRFFLSSFVYLAPLVFLFAFGVFYRTTQKAGAMYAPPASCRTEENASGLIDPVLRAAYWDGEEISIPSDYLAGAYESSVVLGVADPSERWIEVDLSDQKLRAWDGEQIYLESPISSGLPGTPTPTGEFRIWMKLRATRMEGGEGRYYYNLPNVPYVMFFSSEKLAASLGYGLHGTYWHNDFGNVRSHGCVNLPTPIAKILYEWTTPVLSEGKGVVTSSDEEPGTRIVIHE